jgi:hypothetical protein
VAGRTSSLFQANQIGKTFGDPEQLDRDLACCSRTSITNETRCPREAGVSTLRARKDHVHIGGRRGGRWRWRRQAHLNALMAHELHTGAPVFSAAPISPQERGGTHLERMEQHADLAWLCGRAAIPLTLFAQRTGTATADAGSIDHAQASIGFSAPFMREQVLASRTPERAIGLKRKVGSGETPCFPGCGRGRWTVSRDRS